MEDNCLSFPKKNWAKMETSWIETFAPRVSQQFPIYVAWKQNAYRITTNAFSITWNKGLCYAFPPFCLLTQILNKVDKNMTAVDFNDSLLANTVIVFSDFKDVDSDICSLSFNWKSSGKSFRSSSSACEKQNTFISGVDGLWRYFL